jgi:hypothetical protein
LSDSEYAPPSGSTFRVNIIATMDRETRRQFKGTAKVDDGQHVSTVRRFVRRCGYCGTGKIKGLMSDTFSGFSEPRLVPICDPCLQAQYGGETIKALSATVKAALGDECPS